MPQPVSSILDQHGRPISAEFFKSGSTTSHELARWTPPIATPRQESRDYYTINGRAQDLQRNNGYASGAIESAKDNIIGASYKLSLRPNWKALGISHEAANDWANSVEAAFHAWADDPDCWIDAQRKMTFAQMIRYSAAGELVNGEAMFVRQWRPDIRAGFATCFSVIEPERVCTPANLNRSKHGKITNGVETDRYGAAIAYHLKKRREADHGWWSEDKWQRLGKWNQFGWRQFIHIFDPKKGDQQRGASRFSSVIQKMKMLDRYEDVELEAAILGATYSLVIESDFGQNSVFDAISEHTPLEKVFGNLMELQSGYASGINDKASGSRLEVGGVKIPHLFPGEQLKQIMAAHPHKAFDSFEDAMLRHVARGLGTSYEQLTGDYSKTTYSSARAAMMESWKTITSRRAHNADKLASLIFRLWLDEAVSRNVIELPAGMNSGYWDGQNRQYLSRCSWIGAGKGQIDDLKAAKANEIKLRTGETTLQQVSAENGQDYQEVIEQRAREARLIKDAIARNGLTEAEYYGSHAVTDDGYTFAEDENN